MDSTLRVIARVGYAEATVAEIEREAGLSPGAGGLYRHFESKEELLVAAVQRYRKEIDGWRTVVDEIVLADRSQAWEAVPRALIAFGDSQQTAIMALALEGLKFPGQAREQVKAAYDDAHGLFAEGLAKFTGPIERDVDFEAAAIQLFAGLVHFVTQTLAFGSPPSGVSLDRYMESWLRNWAVIIENWRGHRPGGPRKKVT